MKTYANFNEMFNANKSVKSDLSVFNLLDQMTYCDIPTWAFPYLINGDMSGLTKGEVLMIDKWVLDNKYPQVCPPDDDAEHYDEFNPRPEFGKPCATYRCIVYWTDDEFDRDEAQSNMEQHHKEIFDKMKNPDDDDEELLL